MTPRQRLLEYFARHRKELTLGALCVVGSSIFSLAKPLIVGNGVNALAEGIVRADLVRFGLLYVAAAVVEGIFLYLQRSIIIGASRNIEFDMRNDFYSHLQNLPLSFYQTQRTGDLMSRATNDLSSVRMLIGPAVMHAFSSLLVVIGAFVMMARIDLQLALGSLVAVPIVVTLVQYFGKRIHVRFKSVQDFFGDVSARVQENLSGVRVVRSFVQEQHEVATFQRMNREYVERNRSLIGLTATFYPLLHGVIGLLFVIIFYFGTHKILGGEMKIGNFVAFQFYLGRMVWPLIALGWVINLFQRGMASMKRLTDVWNAEPMHEQSGNDSRTPETYDIDIRNLEFSYAATPTLKKISLQIPHGTTVGIVGRTGSGKSTLLSLLARLHEPANDSIFIGGVPVERIPTQALRDLIGAVPQETFLFSETIAENIRFGRADANDAEVREVATVAGLDSDISVLPEGVETVIGERGITLSGGQKQRTAIARAILRNPRILLLDDALSAVDTGTEARILEALRDVRSGRTVIIVSHRVSSVKDADLIVVMEQGSIVERGSHDELLASGGFYSLLYRRQTLEAEIEEMA